MLWIILKFLIKIIQFIINLFKREKRMTDIYISIEGAEPSTDGSELVIMHAAAWRVNDENDWKLLIRTDLNIPADYLEQALDLGTNQQIINGLKSVIEHYGLSSRVPYDGWPSSPTSWNYQQFIDYDNALDIAQAEFDALNNQANLQYARFIEFITVTLGLEFSVGQDNQVKFVL
jgi:hypothetical protein